jgi:hypothetical protein
VPSFALFLVASFARSNNPELRHRASHVVDLSSQFDWLQQRRERRTSVFLMVLTQTGSDSFPPGDTPVGGNYCFVPHPIPPVSIKYALLPASRHPTTPAWFHTTSLLAQLCLEAVVNFDCCTHAWKVLPKATVEGQNR